MKYSQEIKFFTQKTSNKTIKIYTDEQETTTKIGLGNKKIFCGYWFEGSLQAAPETIPLEYNMIVVAFFSKRDDGIPTFSPRTEDLNDEQFLNIVQLWKSQGREVLISLGGGNNDIALRLDQKQVFKDEITHIFNKYGFTGFDIKLEGATITAGANEVVLSEALNELKQEFNAKGKQFLITMSPQFPDLQVSKGSQSYKQYLDKVNYDLVFPQFYNHQGDGVHSSELGWISQSALRQDDFLYALARAIITGTNGYLKIPASKFAIGLPASQFAVLNGQIKDPTAVQYVLKRLINDGLDIRGLATWSINHDSSFAYEFICTYAPMLPELMVNSSPIEIGLNVPINTRLISQTGSCSVIAWDQPVNKDDIVSYCVYCNGIKEIEVPFLQNTYVSKDLNSNKTYRYYVTSKTASGVESNFSNEVCINKPTPSQSHQELGVFNINPNNQNFLNISLVNDR